MNSPQLIERNDLVVPARAPIQTLAFGAQTEIMATGDTRRQLRVFHNDVEFFNADLRSTSDKIRPTERIRGVKFSPDGKRVYAACGDLLSAFDLLSRRLEWFFRPPRFFGFLIVSPSGLTIGANGDVATSTDQGSLYLWDAEGMLKAHWRDNDSPRFIALSANCEDLIGADSYSLCRWNARSGRKLAKLPYPEHIFAMDYDASRDLAAVHSFKHVDVVNATTMERVARLPAGIGMPMVAFSKSGILAIGDQDGVTLYDTDYRVLTRIPAPETVHYLVVSFSPDGRRIAMGCSDGLVRYWDLP